MAAPARKFTPVLDPPNKPEREMRTLPVPLPPAPSAWGWIQLPWPMTAEQWEALEAYMPFWKRGFVREENSGGDHLAATAPAVVDGPLPGEEQSKAGARNEQQSTA